MRSNIFRYREYYADKVERRNRQIGEYKKTNTKKSNCRMNIIVLTYRVRSGDKKIPRKGA